jgi:hypothetical protein
MRKILLSTLLAVCSFIAFAQGPPSDEHGNIKYVTNNAHCDAILNIYCWDYLINCPYKDATGVHNATLATTISLSSLTSTLITPPPGGYCGDGTVLIYEICWDGSSDPNCSNVCTDLLALPNLFVVPPPPAVPGLLSTCGGVSTSSPLADCCHCYNTVVTTYDDPINPTTGLGHIIMNTTYNSDPCE